MPYEEQDRHLQQRCPIPVKPGRRQCACCKGRGRGAAKPPSPAQCYVNIDRDLRGVLRRRSTPLGFVAALEEQLVEAFVQDPATTVVASESSNYHRLLLHSVAQYLNLTSSSETVDGARLTVVRKATRCCSEFSK